MPRIVQNRPCKKEAVLLFAFGHISLKNGSPVELSPRLTKPRRKRSLQSTNFSKIRSSDFVIPEDVYPRKNLLLDSRAGSKNHGPKTSANFLLEA
jgi:hypothetical protein